MATETTGGQGLAEGAKAAESVGMPQLDFSSFPNQIFWLVIALIAIHLILSKIALPRIAAVLAERQGTITNDIAAAEDLKQQAADAEQAYEKALADARAEANNIAAQAKAEMQAEVEAAMAKADAEIAERTADSEARISEIRAGATDAIREVSNEAAREVIGAMGVDLDEAALTEAINSRMKG